MKALYILIFILSTKTSFTDERIFGEYKNGFGEKLILNSDQTFTYTWNFDLASSWNIGVWKIDKNKYIYLTIHEVQDSLKSDSIIKLVLSSDKVSDEITNIQNALNSISGGGQSRKLPPEKLLWKRNKLLYFSKTGVVQNKKVKSILNTKVKLKPWFEKQ